MRPGRLLFAAALAGAACCDPRPALPDPSPWDRPEADRRFRVTADLLRDGRLVEVQLEPTAERTLQVRRADKLLWEGVPRRWRPWKLVLADVDGDRRTDLLVGLHKSTRFFPAPHACLFVYRFTGSTVKPLWLGSSLGAPLVDFAAGPVGKDPRAQLCALQRARDGRWELALFRWRDFGFALEGKRGPWRSARLLGIWGGRVHYEKAG